MIDIKNLEAFYPDNATELQHFNQFLKDSTLSIDTVEGLASIPAAELIGKIKSETVRIIGDPTLTGPLSLAFRIVIAEATTQSAVVDTALPANTIYETPNSLRKERSVERVWDDLEELIPSRRKGVISVITNNFRLDHKYDNPDHPFKLFKSEKWDTIDLNSVLSDEFAAAYANYTIGLARTYLSSNTIKMSAYGQIIADGKGLSNVLVKQIVPSTDPVQYTGVEIRTNKDGKFRFPFSRVKEVFPIGSPPNSPNEVIHTFEFQLASEEYSIGTDNVFSISFNPDPAVDPISPETATKNEIDYLKIVEIIPPGDILGAVKTFVEGVVLGKSYNEITFNDIRKSGLLRLNLTTPPTIDQENDINTIDNMALFELVDSNQTRLEIMYSILSNSESPGELNPIKLASTSRAQFINLYKNEFEIHQDVPSGEGPYEAGKFYESSLAFVRSMNTRIAQTEDPLTPPFPNTDEQGNPILPALDEILTCGCSDCESAVGPQAYLADLLNFVQNHISDVVEIAGDDVTVPADSDWIKENLRQDMQEIPADCSALADTKCQGRIASEILFKEINSSSSPYSNEFENQITNYIRESYKLFLRELGTSYEELQEAVLSTNEEERLEYAHGIGIVLNYEPDQYDTESSGVTIDDIYKDLSSLVKEDERDLLFKYFGLSVANDALSISTNFKSNYIQDWKRFRLREIWRERDMVNSVFLQLKKPIIDPDIITVDDFRNPTLDSSVVDEEFPVYFDIWQRRRNFLDNAFEDLLWLETEPPYQTLRSVAQSISLMRSTSTEALPYYEFIDHDDNDGVDPAKIYFDQYWPSNSLAQLKDYSGTDQELYDEFKLNRAEKDRLVQLESIEEDLLLEQGVEAVNILIASLKRKLTDPIPDGEVLNLPHWIYEETLHKVVLSPEYFAPAAKPIKEGQYPVVAFDKPLIDPEVQTESDFPDITYQENSSINHQGLIDGRRAQLSDFKDDFSSDAIKTKIDEAFGQTDFTYGTSSEDDDTLLQLRAQLDDPQNSVAATTAITEDLKLTIENFVFLMESAEKNYTELSEAEKDRAWSILITSHKVHNLYPGWNDGQNDISGWIQIDRDEKYWQYRKAKLPKWRASTEARNEWLNALQEHSKTPIIHPYLIGPAYLTTPYDDIENTNNPFGHAFQIWQERYSVGESLLSEMANMSNFNDLLNKYLFTGTGINLGKLIAYEDSGSDIAAFLNRLNLSFPDYRYLVKFYDVISGGTLTADQEQKIRFLLLKVQIKRRHYRWLIKEADPGADLNPVADLEPITLSPDFFVNRSQDYTTYPPKRPYPLNEALVSEAELNEWRRTIIGREDEEAVLIKRLEDSIQNVDDETIAQLRDSLIQEIDLGAIYGTSFNTNISLTRKARILGDRFLINLENNCCTKTNATAVAIESLQQLIWKTHTEDITSDYPNVKISVDVFDDVWKWMGTYANWRASMFVFLYPENILLPSLKSFKSEGFENLLEIAQNNRRFNPALACKAKKEYEEYLRDINSLKLNCSIEVDTLIQNDNDCIGEQKKFEKLVYIFATSTANKKVYYSTASRQGPNIEQVQFWKHIPGISSDHIVTGCDVYDNESERSRKLYLFCLSDFADDHNKIFGYLLNLDTNVWESPPISLEIESDNFRIESSSNTESLTEEDYESFDEQVNSIKEQIIQNLDLSIIELSVCKNMYSTSSPRLTVSLSSKYGTKTRIFSFSRKMDKTGTSFLAEETWDNWTCHVHFETWGNSTTARLKESSSMMNEISEVFFCAPPFETEENSQTWWHRVEYYYMFKVDNSGRGVKLHFNLQEDAWVTERLVTVNSDTYNPLKMPFYLPAGNRDYRPFVATPQVYQDFFQTTNTYLLESPSDDAYINDPTVFFLLPEVQATGRIEIPSTFGGDQSQFPVVYQRADDLTFDSKIYISTFAANSQTAEYTVLQFPISLVPDFNAYIRVGEEKDSTLYSETESNSNLLLLKIVEELYYFVPMEIALSLSRNGYYEEALDYFRLVYDFRIKQPSKRKIFTGLKRESELENLSNRVADWYIDPLNPHAISRTRKDSYTRFTIISIANCLLAYANAEFTFDNSESVPRARELYEDINDLLINLENSDPCRKEEKIIALQGLIDPDASWDFVWESLFNKLINVAGPSTAVLDDLIGDDENGITSVLDDDTLSTVQKVKAVSELIDSSLTDSTDTIKQRVDQYEDNLINRYGYTLLQDNTEYLKKSGQAGRDAFDLSLTRVTGFSAETLPKNSFAWLANDGTELDDFSDDRKSGPMESSKTNSMQLAGNKDPVRFLEDNNPFTRIRISGMPFSFCTVPNPIVKGLRMASEANLYKINNCMNIAGMVRELNPFAAPTDATSGIPSIGVGGNLSFPGQISIPPSNFRYQFLVDRSRQLASYAQQMESSFLQYLERFDSESFSQLKAEQDIELAKGNIKLQDLKVTEANSNLGLAELQKERADIQVNGLQGMINDGPLARELQIIGYYEDLFKLQSTFEIISTVGDIAFATLNSDASANPLQLLNTIKDSSALITYSASRILQGAAQIGINAYNRDIQISSILASFDRRKQEWEYQKSIAQQDVRIGNQQIRIANDRIRIAGQEREIADLQLNHAEATLDFLKNKFTNAELYEWMSGVLEDVYSYFLQEATSIARLAEQQLSFERQISLPNLIKGDYWNVNSNGLLELTTGPEEVDRRGLTGSARLIRDITELDQYAFDTTQRKQEVVKVISLSEYDPVQMEIFKNSGIYNFNLSEDHFDRDFPGQYLRTIKRVSVTVIALVPPRSGIKATLLNSGISNVVTGDVLFQSKTIARNPEQVTLSSAYNDYGVFNLQTDNNQYLPFEGTGVETNWKFSMEKAANSFDYNSIADVLVSIEYTSLHSSVYERLVKGRLNGLNPQKVIALSLKNDLPDTWYDLLNFSDQISSEFEIRESDIAPHGRNPMIKNVRVFMSHEIESGVDASLDQSQLVLTMLGGGSDQESIEIDLVDFVTNPATPYNYENYNTGDSGVLNELSPVAKWRIEMSNTTEVRQLIEDEKLNDILIIINYDVDKIEYTI